MIEADPKLIFRVLFGIAAALYLSGCLAGGEEVQEPVVEYNGVGLHQAKQQTTQINGIVQFKNHTGEAITLEARHSVPCAYGRCPVIGNPPVASTSLAAPGPFSLIMTQAASDLMLIATCKTQSGETRIAHASLNSEAPIISEIHLSFDRPYAPLR